MSWPSAAEFTLLVLTVPCFRCEAAPGNECLTDPSAQAKVNPYTGGPAFHQRRLDTFWEENRSQYRLPSKMRLPVKRGQEGAIWS